ncbi:MAG TPA: DNA primase [Candidatus Kapabacteria bacterium]|nr:DNA primase [Candidatus Kapabacteria bacterium]
MAGIPEEIVERVKSEVNIVDVVSDYIRLRRTGKNWLGLCPFHDDSKPSLHVEPVRGIFKCFACGKGGNVFTFLMELNGWTFPETVRNLAQSLGIEIPEDERERKGFSEHERLAAAVRDAALFFQQTLRSEAGAVGLAYFRKRGFNDETIMRFGLGYAPEDWETLLKHLSRIGYSSDELERAGLVIRREGRTGHYDRFRGRTIFPIFNPTGRILGFGARRMNEDPDQPKYINSPDSPIYHKSRLLYGLFQAKDTIRRGGVAVVVEGYVDVISLHQAGVRSAIATCGTAMAAEHADLIARYCSRVVLVFDSDKAGQSATERGIDVLLRKGLDVSVLRLPDGEDPDTFVQRFGAKEFEGRVERSTSFLEFLARTMKQAGDFDAPDRAAEAVRSIVGTIALIPDALKRELYAQKIAADYFLPEALLAEELDRALGTQGRRRRDLPARSVPDRRERPAPDAASYQPHPGMDLVAQGDEGISALAPRKPLVRSELPAAEVGLLSVLVEGDTQMLEHVFARIDPDDFSHPLTKELVGLILGHYVNQRSFSIDELVMEDLSSDLRDLVTLLAIEQESISTYWSRQDIDTSPPNPWRVARDCMIRIVSERLERETRSLQGRTAEFDPQVKLEHEDQVLVRIRQLTRELEDLRRAVLS